MKRLPLFVASLTLVASGGCGLLGSDDDTSLAEAKKLARC